MLWNLFLFVSLMTVIISGSDEKGTFLMYLLKAPQSYSFGAVFDRICFYIPQIAPYFCWNWVSLFVDITGKKLSLHLLVSSLMCQVLYLFHAHLSWVWKWILNNQHLYTQSLISFRMSILIFICRINFMLRWVEHWNKFYNLVPRSCHNLQGVYFINRVMCTIKII